MTFTDEQMDEYAAWAESASEPDNTPDPDLGVPDEYAHLTPSEQAEAVDEDAREEERERQARAYLEGPDAYWTR